VLPAADLISIRQCENRYETIHHYGTICFHGAFRAPV